MKRSASLVAACIVVSSCDSTAATSGGASAFTGWWSGSGRMVTTIRSDAPALPPGGVPPGAGYVFETADYSGLVLTASEPNVVQVGGLFSSSIGSIPFEVADGGASLVVRGYTSTPAAIPCPPDPSCSSSTDSVVVRDGSARLDHGFLSVVVDGERTICCASMPFAAHFLAGTRTDGPP